MKLLAKEFLALLNFVFKSLNTNDPLELTVSMKIAEIIRINNKRYPICIIKFKQNNIDVKNKNELLKLTKDANCTIFITDDSIVLEFAVVD